MKEYHYREPLNSTINKVFFFDSLKSPKNKSIDLVDIVKSLTEQYPESTIAMSKNKKIFARVHLEDHYYFLKLFYDKRDLDYLENIDTDEIYSLFKSFNSNRLKKIQHFEIEAMDGKQEIVL
jgi:hypothetical protein